MLLNSYIDHTLLKPDATTDQIEKLCQEAVENSFASVCINGVWVAEAAALVRSSQVKVCTVIGFPLGAMSSESKAYEALNAVGNGAEEIDMVISIGLLKSGRDKDVRNDIELVRNSCTGKVLKVIIETCLLTNDEKRRACICALDAGADFVKTSTGFSSGGATIEDVRLMAECAGQRARVKASGGIRTRESALAMIEAGASRLGTSNGVAIISGGSAGNTY